jgi:hypothetical protein
MVDCGSSQTFSPAEFCRECILPHLDEYKEHSLAQLTISHPHTDHFSDIFNVFANRSPSLVPQLLTCPHDKSDASKEEHFDFSRLQIREDDEQAQALVSKYREVYSARSLPLQTILFDARRSVPDLEYGIYYLRPSVCSALYPKDDPKYINSTSIVLFLRYGHNTVLFPGDIPPEALQVLLNEGQGTEKRYTKFDREFSTSTDWHKRTTDQPSLRSVLGEYGLTILVAPHHGLESCYSPDLFECIDGGKPRLVVISEKRHKVPQDGNVDPRYQSRYGSRGLRVEIDGDVQRKYSVSTRNGHHILVEFVGTGMPRVYMSKDPYSLV